MYNVTHIPTNQIWRFRQDYNWIANSNHIHKYTGLTDVYTPPAGESAYEQEARLQKLLLTTKQLEQISDMTNENIYNRSNDYTIKSENNNRIHVPYLGIKQRIRKQRNNKKNKKKTKKLN